jgi:DNA-binding NtrC family response regulator
VPDFPQIRAQVEDIATIAQLEAVPTVAPGTAELASLAQPANGAAAHDAALPGVLNALDRKGNVRTLADVELEMIRFAIDHYHGQMSEVARRLGIGRSTLYRKLKEYGIDPETGRAEKAPQ